MTRDSAGIALFFPNAREPIRRKRGCNSRAGGVGGYSMVISDCFLTCFHHGFSVRWLSRKIEFPHPSGLVHRCRCSADVVLVAVPLSAFIPSYLLNEIVKKRVSSFPLVPRAVGILLRTLSSKSDDLSMINQAVADPIRFHAEGLFSPSQAEAGMGIHPGATTARESEVSSDPARILWSTSPRLFRDRAESWTGKVVSSHPHHSASRESHYGSSQAMFAAN